MEVGCCQYELRAMIVLLEWVGHDGPNVQEKYNHETEEEDSVETSQLAWAKRCSLHVIWLRQTCKDYRTSFLLQAGLPTCELTASSAPFPLPTAMLCSSNIKCCFSFSCRERWLSFAFFPVTIDIGNSWMANRHHEAISSWSRLHETGGIQ